ncbi:hypothetical protein BDV95DRAFT_626492 [Massariosphaeria phaeospora]|uniref:Uncharacterized protein n=1 Tax=Massariosphaeria phaeospora TaxID=100035 RepID=A0A7C8IEE2_9PLEO|nr:hypothetical protein BDV95DRAFT_626492 [Massariosphaeria phaeospora]
MQAFRRTALSAARQGRTPLTRQSRRYAHDEHAHGHSSGPVNESMGSGFWITLGVFPTGYALYWLSRQDPDSPSIITRIIDRYTEEQEKLIYRNDVHVKMIEQAGQDRVLFNNTKPDGHFEMRFPEMMNVGSPYNVVAGQQVNMDKVIAKFKKEAYEDNERKLEALRNNQIKSEQPFERYTGGRHPPRPNED